MTEQREPNILLVEDTEEHAILMQRALESGKVKPRIFVIRDGWAALEFLHNQGAYTDSTANPRPDLILLDLKLPKVSGLQILEHLKGDKELQNVPVVVLTASDEGSDIIRCHQGGAEGYFTKSVLFLKKEADPSAILDTIMALAGV